jgi:heme exporter protein A
VGALAGGPVVVAQRISRRYESGLVLRPLTMQIAAGERVALLGPNGAGKTTLLRLISTLLPPSSGQLRLFGLDPQREALAVRARLGVVAHQSLLHPELTATENLRYYAGLYGVADAGERIRVVLQAVDLAARAGDRVRSFSRGMQQRLALARALLHRPELLLLDEPDAGLDVRALDFLPRVLTGRDGLGASGGGTTVIFTTHQIERALAMAQRVLVMVAGRLVFDGPATALDTQRVGELYGGGAGGH